MKSSRYKEINSAGNAAYRGVVAGVAVEDALPPVYMCLYRDDHFSYVYIIIPAYMYISTYLFVFFYTAGSLQVLP